MALDIFTESTLNDILEKVKLQNAYLSLMTATQNATPWEAYQAISDAGRLPEVLSVGDVLTETWTDISASPEAVHTASFKVMHFGDAEDENGRVYHNKAFLCWTNSTPYLLPMNEKSRLEVDLTEEDTAQENTYYVGVSDTTYTLLTVTAGDPLPTTYDKVYKLSIPCAEAVQYGYNRWKTSVFRQWLNSDAPVGEWFEADFTGHIAPPQLASRPGFLSGFSEHFVSFLRPYKVRTLLTSDPMNEGATYEDTYDRVFLPSVENVMGVPTTPGVEGEAWDAMKALSGLSTATNDAAASRIVYDIANPASKRAVRLRTPAADNNGKVYGLSSSGTITVDPASNTSRCTPVIRL